METKSKTIRQRKQRRGGRGKKRDVEVESICVNALLISEARRVITGGVRDDFVAKSSVLTREQQHFSTVKLSQRVCKAEILLPREDKSPGTALTPVN